MAFTITANTEAHGATIFTLTGELDASSAPAFKTEIEALAAHMPTRLVLVLDELTYMASAGLRVLIFARQKMSADVQIYCVNIQPTVLETLEMAGLQHSVFLVGSLDEALAGL